MMLKTIPEHLYFRGDADPEAALRLRYLGTAGFVLESGDHTMVIDPFVTRPGLFETGFKPLVSNHSLVEQVIPRADDVVIGHAHHDHILDAPDLCHRTGARFIGSPDACNVARAAGLPETQMVETVGRERIETSSGHLVGLPSEHGRVYFNRVSLPGYIPEPPPWPPSFRDLRHGLVLNWYIEMGGVKVVHVDTAEFFNEEVEPYEADVLCLCAIGRKYRPNYVRDAVELLKPKVIVACHWDWFFTPYHAPAKLLPGVDIEGFLREIEECGVEGVVLPFDGVMSFQESSGR